MNRELQPRVEARIEWAEAALTAETVAARTDALAELEAARADDPLAPYVAGSVGFFVALEKLGGGLHRHGFESPSSFMLPLLRLPVPDNPNPEPLTYEGFRQILADFREAMAQSGEAPQVNRSQGFGGALAEQLLGERKVAGFERRVDRDQLTPRLVRSGHLL